MTKAQTVFKRHMDSVSTLDPLKVVDDYTEDAIFITPERTYIGRAEIHDFYKGLLPQFENFKFQTIKQESHGNIAYFVWKGKNSYLDIESAMDTYIIENGKIKYHTFIAITKNN